MMRLARERGADLFELFSNAPMWWMNCYIRERAQIIDVDDENTIAAYDPQRHQLVIVVQTAAGDRVTYDLSCFTQLGGTYTRITTDLASGGATDRQLAVADRLKLESAQQKKLGLLLSAHAVETIVLEDVRR
jgi:hypothetical protein